MEKRLFTSECVTNGHPDKVADSISDAILDACLAQDPTSRVACETMVTTNFCLICGEITTKAQVDYPAVAREAIRKIGYVYPGDGFDADSVEIQCRIHTQSADIALGTNDEVGGAGDQGMMFGGACTQTPELMPLPVALSRALSNRLTECVHSNDLLRPDGKTQVTVEYDEKGNVIGIDTVVVSIMHAAEFEIGELRRYIREGVIAPVLMGVILWRAGKPLLSFHKEPEIWALLRLADGTSLPVTHWENIIGSHKRSDIVIPLGTISRNHAVLTRYDDGSWTVSDAQSKSGVKVNGKRMEICALHPGDVIDIGGVEMTMEPISAQQVKRLEQLRTRGSSAIESISNLLLLINWCINNRKCSNDFSI